MLEGSTMHIAKTMAAIAVIALASAPTFAKESSGAEKLSLANGTSNGDASGERKGGKSNVALIALGGAAVVGAALALGSNDSKPASN